MEESKPFIQRLIHFVQPQLVVLTGVKISEFSDRFEDNERQLIAPEKEATINQTVLAASRVRIPGFPRPVLVAQVAHASQFSWTYDRFQVTARIRELWEAEQTAASNRTNTAREQ
jgi:hypothetical protein